MPGEATAGEEEAFGNAPISNHLVLAGDQPLLAAPSREQEFVESRAMEFDRPHAAVVALTTVRLCANERVSCFVPRGVSGRSRTVPDFGLGRREEKCTMDKMKERSVGLVVGWEIGSTVPSCANLRVTECGEKRGWRLRKKARSHTGPSTPVDFAAAVCHWRGRK